MAEKTPSAQQKLVSAQKAYAKKMHSLANASKPYQALVSQVADEGKNYIRQTERLEDKSFDSRFVEELETGFDSIDRIILNPRTFIRDEAEVVNAGLAKKITAESIVHLASHTQFVHTVDENGNVTPERILTIHAETDVQIYENRFIMTLMKKCALFIEKRYQFIKSHGETFNSDLLLIHATSNIDGARYEVDTRVKVSVPSEDQGKQEANANLLVRLATLRERCAYYLHSPFMEQMKGAKDVFNPLHLTNLLLKNPDYHAAYKLWTFIDNYTNLGITYDVKETEQEFDDAYFEEIYGLVVADMLTLHSHSIKDRKIDHPVTRQKTIRPKVLFTLEDETFHDGRFLYDQFPDHKQEKPDPMALTPDEAKAERLALEEKYKQDIAKKLLLDEAIAAQKAIDMEQETKERQRQQEAAEEAAKKARDEAIHQEVERLAREEWNRRKKQDFERIEEEARLDSMRYVIRRQGKEERQQSDNLSLLDSFIPDEKAGSMMAGGQEPFSNATPFLSATLENLQNQKQPTPMAAKAPLPKETPFLVNPVPLPPSAPISPLLPSIVYAGVAPALTSWVQRQNVPATVSVPTVSIPEKAPVTSSETSKTIENRLKVRILKPIAVTPLPVVKIRVRKDNKEASKEGVTWIRVRPPKKDRIALAKKIKVTSKRNKKVRLSNRAPRKRP